MNFSICNGSVDLTKEAFVNNFGLYLFAVFLFSIASLSANWSPVCGAESAVVFTTNAGKSKTFRNNPERSEFYKYSPRHHTQTRAIYGGFVGLESQVCPNWKIQGNITCNQSTPFLAHGTFKQGVDVQSQDTYHYRYKILVRQLLFCGKLTYATEACFQPFVMVGIGPSFNRGYSFSTNVPSFLTFTRMYKNHTSTAFTYAFGLGFDILLLDNLKGGISYRFANLGRASLGHATIDRTPVCGTLSQDSFYANEVFAQLTVVF